MSLCEYFHHLLAINHAIIRPNTTSSTGASYTRRALTTSLCIGGASAMAERQSTISRTELAALRPRPSNKPTPLTRYLKVAWPGHPLAHRNGAVYLHRAILFDTIGDGVHSCYWCGKSMAWNTEGMEPLHADHVNNDRRDNRPENLVPSCFVCNIQRSTRGRTHCGHGHAFTPENTYIRPDDGSRQCRTCRAMAVVRLTQRRKACGD
jgi:hypothetical protein